MAKVSNMFKTVMAKANKILANTPANRNHNAQATASPTQPNPVTEQIFDFARTANTYFASPQGDTALSAQAARDEQLGMRTVQRLQDEFGAEYETALQQYQEQEPDFDDSAIIPESPDYVRGTKSLCTLFDCSSVDELRSKFGETDIVDYDRLQNGGYSEIEIRAIASDLQEVVAEAERQSEIDELNQNVSVTETLDDIQDQGFKSIALEGRQYGVPVDKSIYFTQELIAARINEQEGLDGEITLSIDDDGYYCMYGGGFNGERVAEEYGYQDMCISGYSIYYQYCEYLKQAEPEKYALATTIYNNPADASNIFIANCGGDGNRAAEILQQALNIPQNNGVNFDEPFYSPEVYYDKDSRQLMISYCSKTVTLSEYINNCTTCDLIHDSNERGRLYGLFITSVSNSNYQITPTDSQTALNNLASGNTTIVEDIESTSLVSALWGARTKDDAYNVILAYCGGNRQAADIVYEYLIPTTEDTDDSTVSDSNPYYRSNPSALMDKLYDNCATKYVLSQDLLSQFAESEVYGFDNDGEPQYRPTTEYYTNIDGEVCTLNWHYSTENGRDIITLNFEENDSSRELKFYQKQDLIGDNYYYIYTGDENGEVIVESENEFMRRLAVAQNYGILGATNFDASEDCLAQSTDEIDKCYTVLTEYDRNMSGTLSNITAQFGKEGVPDHLRNWFSETFNVGTSKDDVLDVVGASTQHTLIMSQFINGDSATAQAMVEEELERRLSSCDSVQDTYSVLCDYYGEDIAREIIQNIDLNSDNTDNFDFVYNGAVSNADPEAYIGGSKYKFGFDDNNQIIVLYCPPGSSEFLPVEYDDTAINLVNQYDMYQLNVDKIHQISPTANDYSITKEHAYAFLTRGGDCSIEARQTYQVASNLFTDYNTVVAYGAALSECSSPEDAFYLITGKKIDDSSLTDEDIQKFNDFYGVANSEIFEMYICGSNVYGQMWMEYSRENGFQIAYRESSEDGMIDKVLPQYYSYEDVVNGDADIRDDAIGILSDWEYDFDLTSLNSRFADTSLLEYGQNKFNVFYAQNETQVNTYIDNYAAWAASDPESIRYYSSRVEGEVTPESIAKYIKLNPDNLYNESCKYMQYAYTTAKQTVFGESELDNVTNQYCMEMKTYASNLSHMLSMGCIVASVVFPAAAPALMTAAKVAGYVDNAIDLLNMLTNRQNASEDDYLGWATSTGFEWLTKRGYQYFGGLAGNYGGKFTEWAIDHTGGTQSFLANHALAQILFRGSSEAVIETGICLPWTMMIKGVQGGDYNLLGELKENFIYDFLPYARGWQDIFIGKVDTTLYGGNGNYFRVNGSNEIAQVDDAGRVLGIFASVRDIGDAEHNPKPLVSYDYGENGSVRITRFNANGGVEEIRDHQISGNTSTIRIYGGVGEDGEPDPTKLLQSTETTIEGGVTTVRYIEYQNGNPVIKGVNVSEELPDGSNRITYYSGVDEEGKPTGIKQTIVTENTENGTVTRYYNGVIPDSDTQPTRVETKDAKGRLQSVQQGNTAIEYDRSGNPTKLTIGEGDNTVTVNYRTTWSGQTATIQAGDSELVYKIDADGKAYYEVEGTGERIPLDEQLLLRMASSGMSLSDIADKILVPEEDRQTSNFLARADAQDGSLNRITDSTYNELERQIATELGYDTTGEYTPEQKEVILAKMLEQEPESAVRERAQILIANEKLSPADAYNIARQLLSSDTERACIDLHINEGISIEDSVKLLQNPLVSAMKPNQDFVLSLYREHNVPISDGLDLLESGFKGDSVALDNILRIYDSNDSISVADATRIYSAKLNPDQEERAIKYITDNGISSREAVYLAQQSLDSATEAKVIQLTADKGVYAPDAVAIAMGEISEEDYMTAFNHFKGLTDNNGQPIFENSRVISYIINVAGDSSPESSDIDMLISLVQDGTVGRHVFNYIPELGKPSELISGDIDRLFWISDKYSDYNGTKVDPADIFVPRFSSLDEAQGMVRDGRFVFYGAEFSLGAGDVLEIEGSDRIYVVENDGSLTQLGIDRQTYMTLFPPIERYATTQNKIGNCWELSGINSLLCNEDTRPYVLKMFSQDDNGDITVTFPGDNTSVTFKNCSLPDGTNDDFYSQGAMGVRMLEYTNGCSLARQRAQRVIEDNSGICSEETIAQIRAIYAEQGLNVNMDIDFGSEYRFDDQFRVIADVNALPYRNNHFDSVYSELRNGGQTDTLYDRMGLANSNRIDFASNPAEAQRVSDFLSNPESFKNSVISAGTTGSNESSMNDALGIAAGHEYRVNMGQVEDGKVKTLILTNPWGTYSVELTPEEFMRYFGVLHTADKPQAPTDTVRYFNFNDDVVSQASLAGLNPDRLAQAVNNDMFGRITQTDDVSCAVASALNGIGENSGAAQAFTNKFTLVGVDDTGARIYQAPEDIFGANCIITVGDDSNLLVEAFKIYQGDFGTELDGGTQVSKVLEMMMPDASPIKIQPNSDNISNLRTQLESGNSPLVFSTSQDSIMGLNEQGETVDISPNHAYTVVGIDENGQMRLSDPTEPDKTITVNSEDYLGKDGSQIVGRTYDPEYDERLYDDTLEENKLFGWLTPTSDKYAKKHPEYQAHLAVVDSYTVNRSQYRFVTPSSLQASCDRLGLQCSDDWAYNNPTDEAHGPWKMHIYASNDYERQLIMDTCGRYLTDNGVDWKVLAPNLDLSYLDTMQPGGIERGKVFTIYPRSVEDMEQLSCDLYRILENNGLVQTHSDASIIGDAPLGNNGRLFYRYEFKSKYSTDRYGHTALDPNFSLDLGNTDDYDLYYNPSGTGMYEFAGNRDFWYNQNGVPRNGARHLASDMTIDDDPWRKFDPSDPRNNPLMPIAGLSSNSNQPLVPPVSFVNNPVLNYRDGYEVGDYLPKNQDGISLNSATVIGLPAYVDAQGIHYYQIDFGSQYWQNITGSMQEGQSITIGRNGADISLGSQYDAISSTHLILTKSNGRIYIKDVSTNGTILIH